MEEPGFKIEDEKPQCVAEASPMERKQPIGTN